MVAILSVVGIGLVEVQGSPGGVVPVRLAPGARSVGEGLHAPRDPAGELPGLQDLADGIRRGSEGGLADGAPPGLPATNSPATRAAP